MKSLLAVSLYTGDFKDMGNQSIRLNPVGSDLIERMATGETREYILDVSYTFKEKDSQKRYLGTYTSPIITHRSSIFSEHEQYIL